MAKIYHVKTQADYDALMVKLEKEGYERLGSGSLMKYNNWKRNKDKTCIDVHANKSLSFADMKFYGDRYDEIIEYTYTETNNVNSPNHYTAGGIETIDYIKAKMTSDQFAGYCTGNILKYISRYPFKNGVEDLEKAKVYLEWLITAEGERL